MIQAIFFDFDGVIVESADIKTNAFAELFEREGKDAEEKVVEYHLKNAGVSRYDKFKYIYKEILNRSLGNDEFQRLCGKFAGLVMEAVVLAPYVKGAKEFIESFASKYLFFIVTATPQEEIDVIIRRRAINHFFKAIYGAPTKKSDAVKYTLSKLQIKSNNTVYVGDAMSDYRAAKDNSVNFVARINNNESVFKDINCVKIKDLTGLASVIEKL
jgi:HAD superfamily hydrolase (TIGR01549 family)